MGMSKPALNSLNAHLKVCKLCLMALLQIQTTPLGQGLPSPATLLFNHPVYSVMPVIDRKPVERNNDDEHHSKLVHRQHKHNTNNDASPVFASIPIGSTVAVQ